MLLPLVLPQVDERRPPAREGGYLTALRATAAGDFNGAYTAWLAKQQPELMISCCSPGYIATAIVAGFGATKPPEEGTVSIRKCLFDPIPPSASGWYYGSDGVRSPYHFMRNPGEPPYDGVPPS